MKIAELTTTNLLYFDPDHSEECAEFCRRRHIDLLPDIDDQHMLYRLDPDTGMFKRCEVGDGRIDADDDAIDRELIERFRASHILVVFRGQTRFGVIHFSDYNRDCIGIYLYGLLRNLERTTRSLLILEGLRDQDMVDYLECKKDNPFFARQLESYHKRASNGGGAPFEMFDISPLAAFAKHTLGIHFPDEVIGGQGIRNMIMHSHELVAKQDSTPASMIYDFGSFEAFLTKALTASRFARKLENRLTIREGLDRYAS